MQYNPEPGTHTRVPGSTSSRFYGVAGITVRVEAPLPITDQTFEPKFSAFRLENPGPDLLEIRHHFGWPKEEETRLGAIVFQDSMRTVYRRDGGWAYMYSPGDSEPGPTRSLGLFDEEHVRGDVYHERRDDFLRGGLNWLGMIMTDQVQLAWALSKRQAALLHAAAVDLGGQGLVFTGHSGAGKSTLSRLLHPEAQVLCDDRVVLRRWPDGFLCHGTWGSGTFSELSAASAPLRAICFLEQAEENRLIPIEKRGEIVQRLLALIIRPIPTAVWWERTLDLAERVAREVPAYRLRFDRSGRIRDELEKLVR